MTAKGTKGCQTVDTGSRVVAVTKGWVEPKANADEEMQEEKLLDEQKQI